MSTAIAKNFQIGADSTPSNNFTLYQPASPDGTLRLGNGNTGTTSSLLTLTSAGSLNFGGTAARITGDFSNATAANRVLFQSSTANGFTAVSVIPNGTSTSAFLQTINNADPANASTMQIAVGASESQVSASRTGTGSFLPMTFFTGGSERMRLDTSGNLGIGTSSPTQRLVVSHDQAANSYFDYYNVTNGGGIVWRQIVRNIANTGTTSVDLAKVTGGAFLINNNDTDSANYTAFGVGGSERARIDSTGGLRVGLTTNIFNGPSTEKLTVRNTSNGCAATFEAANVAGGFPVIYVSSTLADGATQNAIQFVRSTVSVGTITTTTTSTAYNTSSDYRLKHDIAPMTGALAKIAALKPVTYKWNADDSDGEGFIAHELAEVVPQCVTGEKDAVDAEGKPVYQGIDTSFLVATLTAAIQELNAKLEAQAAEIAALKGTA